MVWMKPAGCSGTTLFVGMEAQCNALPASWIFSLNIRPYWMMRRYDRPSHQVYMYFFLRSGWQVQFLEPDLKTPLPVSSRLLIRRGDAVDCDEQRLLQHRRKQFHDGFPGVVWFSCKSDQRKKPPAPTLVGEAAELAVRWR
jgi:hypothetical protein